MRVKYKNSRDTESAIIEAQFCQQTIYLVTSVVACRCLSLLVVACYCYCIVQYFHYSCAVLLLLNRMCCCCYILLLGCCCCSCCCQCCYAMLRSYIVDWRSYIVDEKTDDKKTRLPIACQHGISCDLTLHNIGLRYCILHSNDIQ